ncbi:MAG TPA: DUF4214 domain-containing protein [Pyrinomonadaceae bacterium]|nr:DUF4214 domain-containing protein [Pyrinomonadaceae bacterium]
MNKKLLCTLALAVLWLFASPQKAHAQCSYGVAYGVSWTWQDNNAVYGYSATALDYCAGLYYDPAVYGRFSEGNFATENVRLLAEGYSEGYADWIPAEVLFGYGSPIGFQYYNTDSIHYVLEYYQYYACFSYCGYYWYDPWGFGFASPGPTFSGGGGINYWAVRRRRLGTTYHTIIYQPPNTCQPGQQFTSTGVACATPTPTPTPTGTPSQSVTVNYVTETQNKGIPMGNGTAQVGLPNRNSTEVVATGSPAGGEYIWSTSSSKVSLSPNGNKLTITAREKSDQAGDVVINLSYKLSDGRHADVQIPMTVQQPGSMKFIRTVSSGPLTEARRTRRQRVTTGWKKVIDWQVIDHLGTQPMMFRMPIADTINNTLPNDCFVPRMGHGTTLAEGKGTGNGGQWTHTYELFSTACMNGGNCGVDGFQRYTVNGFELSNDDKDYRYQCNGIKIEGDGSNLTPSTPPARKKVAMFVDQVYVGAFGDWASDDELLTWTNRLNNAAALGQSQLLAEARVFCRAVFGSAEYRNVSRSDEDFVSDLYNGYLGRAPEPTGLQFWVNIYRNDLAQGIDGYEHLLQGFEGSGEFMTLVSNLEAAPPPVVCDPVDEQFCWNNGGLWDSSTCSCEYPPPYDPCYPYYCYY